MQIKAKTDSLNINYPAEKLYLQLDKPNYAIGDTIWFKAYLFNAPTLALSAQSGILYIDIINDNHKLIRQNRLTIKQGLSWGDISLNDLQAGNYLLRAYTTWMRNFGPECFFYKKFIIAGEPGGELSAAPGRSNPNSKAPVRTASKVKKNFNHVDVQFLPEGGNLVAGLPAHIAFKAIGEDGKGVNIAGVVSNNEGQDVARFSSVYSGMGSFNLFIKPGEHYKVRVNLPDGNAKDYPLPGIQASGTILKVNNPADEDSVQVTMRATQDLVKSRGNYFLIGKARDIICYAAIVQFTSNDSIIKKIPKALFPNGITHFILLSVDRHALNERLIFINHHDDTHIDVSEDRKDHDIADSMSVNLKFKDISGNPVTGNFSLVVTDDEQVTMNSWQNNIITQILLSSELKGYLEQPGYYFQENSSQSAQALDNLLLTQGWVNYEWSPDSKTQPYPIEKEFATKGRLVSGSNKPAKFTKVTLLSKSPLFLMDALTDNEGAFIFHNFPAIDTPAFIIKAIDKHNNTNSLKILIDDIQSPKVIYPYLIGPTDTIRDTALELTARNNRIRSEVAFHLTSGHMLKEVKIKAQKIIKGSQNMNGPGNADLVLDEKDLENEGKKNLLDVLTERIKNFREGVLLTRDAHEINISQLLHDLDGIPSNSQIGYGSTREPWYFIGDKPVKIFVDGTSVGSIHFNISFLALENYLKSVPAEDIKGIEMNWSVKYGQKYIPMKNALVSPFDVCFIEITTRSGNGPIMNNLPDVLVYKPMPLSRPKEFYKPLFIVRDTARHAAVSRATISWTPNLIPGTNGTASMSFPVVHNKSSYTILIEGTDLNGNLGFIMRKVRISHKQQSFISGH